MSRVPAREEPGPRERLRRACLLLSTLAALAVLPGCIGIWGRAPYEPGEQNVAYDSRLAYNRRVYDVAWDAVRRHYYDGAFRGVDWNEARDRHRVEAEAADDDAALYDAINALLAELDDEHTYASTPDEVDEDQRHQDVLVGLITAPYEESDTRRLVLDVLPGSSAEELGVRPGWVLVSCEGRPPAEVLGPGRLREGDRVVCAFLDSGDATRTIALTARPVSVDPIRTARTLKGGWLLMRFDRFDLSTAEWVRAVLKENKKAPGVIVDLRQNPGGEALALARSLGEFFPRDIPMGRFVRRSGYDENLRASPGWFGARYPGKVAVLVSENTGSSGEIFAHTMKQQKRGVVVGVRTAGAVLGAETGPLPGGGELQVSVRDYLTADGRRLEGVGVVPDIEVQTTVTDLRASRDPVLEAALQYLIRAESR